MSGLELGPAFQAISMATTVAGAIGQGRAQSRAAKMQARFLEEQAQREAEIGELNAERIADENKSLLGVQRALMAQGRDLSSGSALLLQEDLAEEGKFQELLAKDAGEVKSRGLRQEALLERMRGKTARVSSIFRAGKTLLDVDTDGPLFT